MRIYKYLYIYISIYASSFPTPHLKTKPQNHFFLISPPGFFGKKNIKTTQLPFPGGNIRATELYLRNASTTSNASIDRSSCRFRFHGWIRSLEANHGREDRGFWIPLFHPNTQRKNTKTAFLQNYGDGWLEPTTTKMCIFPKGVRIPTGYNPPREKLRSVIAAFI